MQDQRQASERLEKTARLQTALYTVANLASAGLDMQDTLRRIHDVVGALMYARNFLIALYDGTRAKPIKSLPNAPKPSKGAKEPAQ